MVKSDFETQEMVVNYCKRSFVIEQIGTQSEIESGYPCVLVEIKILDSDMKDKK